jgi:GT2 family glycosyltransferase
MFSIVIPTIGNYESLLAPCIDSILKYSLNYDYEIIIVNNGIPDATFFQLQHKYLENTRIVFCSYTYNLGAAVAINTGIKLAKGEYVVILNDDTVILGSEWLGLLARPFQEDSKVMATGSLQLFSPDTKMPFLVFFCVMMLKWALEKWPISEEFGVGYGEDIDWCTRVQREGFKIVEIFHTKQENGMMVGGFPIYHKAEGSVHSIKDWDKIIEKNRGILRKKYGPRF